MGLPPQILSVRLERVALLKGCWPLNLTMCFSLCFNALCSWVPEWHWLGTRLQFDSHSPLLGWEACVARPSSIHLSRISQSTACSVVVVAHRISAATEEEDVIGLPRMLGLGTRLTQSIVVASTNLATGLTRRGLLRRGLGACPSALLEGRR